MGQRTIDTILRVQSESEYKQALKNCTSELKVMKSELDKATSEYRTNANSMEALTAKGEVLAKMYDAQERKVGLLRGALEKAQSTRDAEEKKTAELREQYEQANNALKAYGDTLGKTSQEYQDQQAQVEKLRDAVIEHQKKLDASTSSVDRYTIQLNRAEVELNGLRDKQQVNTRLMDEAARSADGCATSIDRYGDAVREAADDTDQSTSAVEAMAAAMVATGVQQKVEDLAASMMECSKAAQSYELAIAQVGTIADENVISSKNMQSGILQLSTELRTDANEVAEAVYNALSAGVDTADVLQFTAQSSQLATAGFTDMGTSVDVLTTILNAYKLESSQTEKVASTLVKTQDLGKVTVDQLGKVIGRVIPSAAAYGVNLDNIATAYANMTAAGINAENSTTYLSTMLDELATTGSAVAIILQEQTGKSFAELMASGASLGDVLEILGASVQYDNTQFSNLWSSATAGKAAIALFDGSAVSFNNTLQQMANSSGTVAKNYQKMTAVSDYSSQRMEVAAKNLKIAVGDQLNPVLDKLREAGAGVLEEAARIVADNPALVAAIAGTTTALGLLAGGVSALMIVKSVTAAMQALNITLAANPAVLVTTAIVGLLATLGTYIAQIETTREKVDALTESSRALSETVAAGNTSYEDATTSAEAAAATVGQYIDRLDTLEAQGIDTNAQQMEYAMTLDKINALMPGLNTELDAQTGLLVGGTNALRQQVAAWKENAIAEAAYTRYKDDVSALADAEYELAKNKAKLSMAEKDNQPIKDRLTQVTEKLRAAQANLNKVTVAGSSYLGATSKEQVEAQKQVSALEAEYRELYSQIVEVNAEEGILKQAIEESSKVITDAKVEVDAASEAYETVADSMQSTSQAAGDMSDAVDEATQEMQEAYAELLVSARTSLDRQIGLFEDLSGKCEISIKDMIDNLKSQQTAFENYADNIQLAMERGIDIGLVQKLSDGSQESMLILAELVKGTDTQIAELNAVFGNVSKAKDTVAEAMAGVEQTVADQLAKAAEKAEEGGKNIVLGLVKGIKGNKSFYESEVTGMATSGQNAFAKADDSHSPSRKYQKLASYESEAIILQRKADLPKLQASAAEMADVSYASFVQTRQSALLARVGTVGAVHGPNASELIVLVRQLLAEVRKGKILALNGRTLVGETVDDYDTALAQNKILADRGAK